jgi:hypothetical protein
VLVVETTDRLTRKVQNILAKDKNARVITAGDFNEVSRPCRGVCWCACYCTDIASLPLRSH